jgi:hypothetical protein
LQLISYAAETGDLCVGGDADEYRGLFDVFVTLDRSASCFKIDRRGSKE